MAEDLFRPLLIFIAEDNRADVYLVELALKERGLRFALRWVSDGEQAMRAASAFGNTEPVPDIVLLDLNLPREGGSHVLEALRRNSRCRTLPVIVMTSSESQRDRATAERFGAAFFSKPSALNQFFRLGDLVEAMCGGAAGATNA